LLINHLANSAQISEIGAIRASRIDVNQPYFAQHPPTQVDQPKRTKKLAEVRLGSKADIAAWF